MTSPDDRRRAATHVFVDPAALDDDVVALDADTAHHLQRVLRLRDGESVSVSDGAGRWRMSTARVAGAAVVLEALGDVALDESLPGSFTLATAIPKGDRVEWLVLKATEVGVDRIRFLHTGRSVVRWKSQRAENQLERLRRISLEAARQSRRTRLVEIDGPLDAGDVLPHAVVAEPGGRPVTASDTILAVGPEGGWTPEELETAGDHVSLGPNVLRTETAAVIGIALSVSARYGCVQ